MNKIEINTCDNDDLATLKRISIQTFSDTFGEYNTEANMNQFFEESYNLDQLKSEMDDINSQFYFIRVDGDIAGYTKLNVDGEIFELERIYILNSYQKYGLGRLLVDHAISAAKLHNCSQIRLGVWENNDNALAFYQQMGFQKVGQHVFKLGQDDQTDFIYVKKLGARR